MKNKTLRIIIDLLLLLSLIFSIRSWDSNLTAHITVGIVFAFLLAVHVFLNRKWLISITKTLKARKLNKKIKFQYGINLLLIFVWSIAILSGFPAIGYSMWEKGYLFIFSRIHGVSVRVGCLLIITHVFQHRKQIGSYIKRKKSKDIKESLNE